MKRNTLIEYGFLVIAIAFFIMSSWMLFKYFNETFGEVFGKTVTSTIM